MQKPVWNALLARPTRAIKRAPETIRTSDRWYRKPVLYPLSYGGIRSVV